MALARKKVDYNQKEQKELLKLLSEKEKEFLEVSMSAAQGKIKDTHVARKLRKEIAKVKTALRIREMGV
ncbi:MAG TPA: 50S ribosomal protein L29 [Candidatus Nanoarchaeia archaeon]